MNKKIFLPSIGLMALLAACSNDELFENKPISVDNNGRPTVNLVLGAELPEMDEANTRMIGGATDKEDGKWSLDWYWEKDDVLGAGLFEDYSTGNVTNGKYQTNYAFTRADNNGDVTKEAVFKTASPVTVGSYMFYRPYITTADRNKIGHKLGDENNRIKNLKFGNEGIVELGDNNNFFFSPLHQVAIPFDGNEMAAKDDKLPVAFTSAYSYIRIKLGGEFKSTSTTEYWGHLNIAKVELSTLGKDDNFYTEFTVNPQTIAAIQHDMAMDNLSIATTSNGSLVQDDENIGVSAKVIRDILKQDSYTLKHPFVLNGVNYTKDQSLAILENDTKSATKKLIYELNEPYTYNKEGDEFVLYIPVPSGTYNQGTEEYTLNNTKKTGTGVLKLEVYTSEGKATFFLGKENKSVQFRRDAPNRFNDMLYIKADDSNIDFYAYNEKGIDVATEAEWQYALNFIENHSQIFNNKTPRINLNGDIKVNSLPEYKLQIVGEKTITLEGGAFKLNPEKTFLGEDGKNVPTLEVAPNTTLSFAKDIETLKLINNGTVNADQNVVMQSMTSSENAKLNISEGKKVTVNAKTEDASAYDVTLGMGATLTMNAAKVSVNGKMDILGDAIATLNGTTSNTTNNVTLCPTAKLIVNKGEYTTIGDLLINADKDNVVAEVTINSARANNLGNVEVSGKLTAKALTNAEGATLKVNPATGEGRDKSGTVTLTSLTNNGTVETGAADVTKNYFGGTINVTTLNNNAIINTNGELVVNNGGTNKGVITLKGDKYALIQLKANSYTNSGRIVIEEPENYCMYTYYKEWNKLESLKGEGTIETTIKSQSQYEAVLATKDKYAGESNKYTAWDVINKVYVATDLKLTNVSSKQLNYKKEIVLKDNVKLNVANNLDIANLSIEGTNTTIQPISGSATLNVTSMVVNEGKQVDITKDVKLLIKYAAFNNKDYMLNVAGTLNNYGWIDTNNSTVAEANKLSVLVANNGQLINRGKLSQPAVKAFDVNSKEYKFAKSIIAKFDGITNIGSEGARVSISTNLPNSWTNGSTIDYLAKILTLGNVVKIGKLFDTEFVGMIVQYGKNYYTFYDGSQDSNQSAKTIFEPYKDNADGANTALHKKDDKASTTIYMVNAIKTPTLNKAYGPTWFYIHENLGTVDLLNKVWAYGEIKNGDKGTLKGQWSE